MTGFVTVFECTQALLLEDLDKANAARSSLQSQLDTALADLAEARSQLAAAPLARQPQPGEEGRKEREMAEADRLILEGRLEEVGREKKELEERLRVEVERRKKVEGEVEKKMAAATNAPSPSPSTTTGNDSKDVDKLNAELKQNKFVVERLAAKVKEMNKELGDRRDENGASPSLPLSPSCSVELEGSTICSCIVVGEDCLCTRD